jgi:hypothetical protein
MTKTKTQYTWEGMTAEKSGGLFIANVAGIGFFLAAAATVSIVFVPMYMGYSVSSGLQVYKRGFKGIMHDIHAFLNDVHVKLNTPVKL